MLTQGFCYCWIHSPELKPSFTSLHNGARNFRLVINLNRSQKQFFCLIWGSRPKNMGSLLFKNWSFVIVGSTCLSSNLLLPLFHNGARYIQFVAPFQSKQSTKNYFTTKRRLNQCSAVVIQLSYQLYTVILLVLCTYKLYFSKVTSVAKTIPCNTDSFLQFCLKCTQIIIKEKLEIGVS